MSNIIGVYEVVQPYIAIRRNPKVIEEVDNKGQFITNRIGLLESKQKVNIYKLIVDDMGVHWGRISEDKDAVEQWVCIKGLSTTYLKSIGKTPSDGERLNNLEKWARTKGYDG